LFFMQINCQFTLSALQIKHLLSDLPESLRKMFMGIISCLSSITS